MKTIEKKPLEKIKVSLNKKRMWQSQYVTFNNTKEFYEGNTWEQAVSVAHQRWGKKWRKIKEDIWVDASYKNGIVSGCNVCFGVSGALFSDGTVIMESIRDCDNIQKAEVNAIVIALRKILEREQQLRTVTIFTDQETFSHLETKRMGFVSDSMKESALLIREIENKHGVNVKIRYKPGHGSGSPRGLGFVDMMTRHSTRSMFDIDKRKSYGEYLSSLISGYEFFGDKIHAVIVDDKFINKKILNTLSWEDVFLTHTS